MAKKTTDDETIVIEAAPPPSMAETQGNIWKDPLEPSNGYAHAIRSQADNLGDRISNETGISEWDESLTRQEFASDTDMNNIMKNFGLNAQFKPATWGDETDLNMDLQTAYIAVDQAKRAHFDVPEELRAQFPTWRHVLEGAENGTYGAALQQLHDKRKAREKAAEKAAEASASANNVPPTAAQQVTPEPAPKGS